MNWTNWRALTIITQYIDRWGDKQSIFSKGYSFNALPSFKSLKVNCSFVEYSLSVAFFLLHIVLKYLITSLKGHCEKICLG